MVWKFNPRHQCLKPSISPRGGVGREQGYFFIRGQWKCAPGWGRIFTTRFTIMGLHFQELLGWGHTFLEFWGKKILAIRDSNRCWLSWDHENYISPKKTKMESITGHKIDY